MKWTNPTAPRGRADLRGDAGQALVLGALSLLLLALMIMLSFNLSQAIFSKIRIQQSSDTRAYSMAIVEARAFNYISVTNRAMVSAYASMATLHAYMAAASVSTELMKAGRFDFIMMGIIFELPQCLGCGPWCPSCCKHCFHLGKDFKIAGKYGKAARKYKNKIESVDKLFALTIRTLSMLVNLLHASQLAVLTNLAQVLGGKGLDELNGDADRPVSIKSTPLPAGVGAVNLRQLACAVEKPPLISMMAMGCPKVDRENRSRVMTQVADGSRGKWTARHSGLPVTYMFPTVWMDAMINIPGAGSAFIVGHKGSAKLVDSASQGALHAGNTKPTGKSVGGDEHGGLFTMKYCGFWYSSYKAWVFSDPKDTSVHRGGNKSGTKHKFDGVNTKEGFGCLLNGDCFVKFRANPDPDKMWGQPSVYAFTSRDLSETEKSIPRPWEVNASGEVNLKHGAQGTGRVRMKAGEGYAVSRALVYYHRLGDWQEQPNFFNPFWRAKLHPFDRVDLALVLGAAGQGTWGASSVGAPHN